MATIQPRTIKKSSVNLAIATALITTLSISPVYAASEQSIQTSISETDAKNREGIGFGAGMVVGAIFGGPVGAFITGIAGNLIAKTMNDEQKIDDLATAYQREKNDNQTTLLAYQQKIDNLTQSYQDELLALEKNYQTTSELQAQNLLMSLQFSTGSSEIKAHYNDQIDALVKIIKQSPNLTIDLSGYTDKQGSDELNHALSLARINAVKNALINQGIAADRISLFAFGEQSPVVASTDKEISFYDRRVVIQLKSQSTARQTIINPTNDKATQTAKNF